jgi:FkbM family methyltransferase
MTPTTLNTYWYLLRNFRNGFALIRNLRHGGYESCGPITERLVFRDGRTIVHPPNRGGLVPVMLEMWRENVYRLGEFYRPKPGEVVVDVGAHIGLFTLQVLWEEPRCRVIALEPSAENFACLKQNLALAGAGAQAEIHQIGIGGEFGRIKMLEIPTNRSVDARVTPVLETEPGSVGVVPMRHLFELANTNEIALLKMDAEGGEYDAFGKAEPELFARIERIVMEYHDNYAPGTLAMLREKLSATHDLTVFPDAGQLHGRLFAARKNTRNGVRSAHSAGLGTAKTGL